MCRVPVEIKDVNGNFLNFILLRFDLLLENEWRP